MRKTGAEIIAALPERQGITTIAEIPGGASLPPARRARPEFDPAHPRPARTARRTWARSMRAWAFSINNASRRKRCNQFEKNGSRRPLGGSRDRSRSAVAHFQHSIKGNT